MAAAIILRETPEGTRVLLARRKIDTFLEPGKWEFPGGKLEPLEHPRDCLKREIKEELGLAIEVGELFDLASHIYETPTGPVHILLICYVCASESADFKLLDVAEAAWVSADQLNDFNYARADIAIVEKLRLYLTRQHLPEKSER